MLACRFLQACRSVNAAETVLDADGLTPAFLQVFFNSPKAGKEPCAPPVDKVATVELGRDLHIQIQAFPRLFHDLAIGNGPHEIAAQADKALDFADLHSFA